MKWGGYPRISDDPSDLRTGIGRQTEDITAEVIRRGGREDEIAWYPENDTSAFKKKRVKVSDPMGNDYYGYRVIRPVWHQALHDLRNGVINALVVWDLDRLARDSRDLEDAIEAVEHYGATIISATASEIDLSTESGRMMARIFVIMGAKASADTARRVARAHLAHAKTGKPVGGTRPFGWEYDKVTVVEVEAEAIRMIAKALIEGETLRAGVRMMNALGLTTSRGNAWNSATLKQMLRSPRYAGWRVHRGEVALDDHGQPVRGTWEPILDQDTFDRLQARLSGSDERTRKPRRDSRHYLMTGILRCGVCNAVMYGNKHTGEKYYYVCNEQRVKDHGLAGSGLAIDKLVTKYVRMKMDQSAEAGPIEKRSVWDGQGRWDEIHAEIPALLARLGETDVRPGDIYREVGDLEDELTELKEGRDRWLAQSSGPTLKQYSDEEWNALSVDVRRAYVEDALQAVILKPATRRGNTFDPLRLVFVPHEPTGV